MIQSQAVIAITSIQLVMVKVNNWVSICFLVSVTCT